MTIIPGFRLATALAVAAIAATVPLAPAHAEGAATAAAACVAPFELTRLDQPLARTAKRLAGGLPITIVAIGSSSTAGAGASTPAMTYPARLAVELKGLFPRAEINVINRGVNGETARDMLARFEDGVIAEKPDLVVWQVGSNSLLRDHPIKPSGALIREGLTKLKTAGADVILMNPQYAPKVIAKAEVEHMVDLISEAAKEANVDLFQRYAVMRYWRLTENLTFDKFVSSDELHMNDWSYSCLAKLLAGAIAEAATRPTMTAGASGGAITTVGR
jgi:lysophospholipase L1-like esterase